MTIIQWYPGHMAKAKREVTEKLKLVDIVFELTDARLPESARNPMMEEIIKDKPRLLILNKSDLADPKLTQAWIHQYEAQGIHTLKLDAQHERFTDMVIQASKSVLKDKIQKSKDKGIKEREIRGLCLGIPNVGKSTFLNHLILKNVAKTGNKPGVTKAQQWLKSGDKLAVLDTPGILWPKFEDPMVGKKLALTGAIKDTLYHDDDIALFALQWFTEYYPKQLADYYNLGDNVQTQSSVDLLLNLTLKMGYRDDFDRGAQKLIFDIRKGKLGQFTLDLPVDNR